MSGPAPRPGQPHGWNPNQPRPDQSRPAGQPQQQMNQQPWSPGSTSQARTVRPSEPQQHWAEGDSVQDDAVQTPKRRSNIGPLIFLISGLVVLALVIAWVVVNMPKPINQPSFEEQWAQIKDQVPNGEVFGLEWRQGPATKDDYRRVDYLDGYWIENGKLQIRTQHPFDKEHPQELPYDVDGYKNVSISPELLSDFKSYADNVSCQNGRWRSTRMVILPDGTPMFSQRCVDHYSDTHRAEAWTFTINGVEYTTRGQLVENLVVFDAVLRHMNFDVAKIELTGSGPTIITAESCLMDCRTSIYFSSLSFWPTIQTSENIRPKEPLKWSDTVAAKAPAGLPSGYLNQGQPLNETKLQERIDQLNRANLLSGSVTRYIYFVRHTPETFAIVIHETMTSEVIILDQDGNQIQR